MKNLIAIAVLVLLGTTAALVLREEPKAESEHLEKVIRPVDLDRLDTIKVERLEGIGKDRHVERYTLKKRGDVWRMAEPVDFPLFKSKLELMLKTLGSLRVIDIISRKPESHEKFAVDDRNGIKLTAMSKGETLLDIIVGNSSGAVTFARLPGANEVYRMQGGFNYTLDRSIKTFRDNSIVLVEMDDLDKVTFYQGENELTLAREGKGSQVTVKPVGAQIEGFDAEAATSVVRSAVRLNAVDFVDEPLSEEITGLSEGADRYTVVGRKDDRPYEVTLFLGNKMADREQVYVRSSESDQVYRIANFGAKQLRAKAEDFRSADTAENKRAN